MPSPVEVFRAAFDAGQTIALALLNVGAALVAVSIWALPIAVAGLVAWRLGKRWGPVLKQRLL